MILIKKLIIVAIIALLVFGIGGNFSINYIFDKVIGNQILSQLDLDISPEDFTEGKLDSGEEKYVEEIGKDVAGEKVEVETNKSNDAKISVDTKPQVDNQFTTDRLKQIQEDFTTMDKLKVMKMVTSKLSMDEIKGLSSLATGGVGNEELTKIKNTLKEKLDTDGIEYLKDLYKKYN